MERKPNGYWNNKENVFKAAKKYKSRSEFQKGCVTAYKSACKNGWLDEMTWFVRPVVHNKKWTKERVFAEAKKYKTKKEFQKGCGSAYDVARKNKWLDEMTWFVEIRKPFGYWTKENVFVEAKKYRTRGEFQKGCKYTYYVACKNSWLDEIFPKHHSY